MPSADDTPEPNWILETPRLRVRRLDAGDVDDLLAVYGDRDTMRWVGDGQPLERDQCQEWVRVTERNYAARGYGMFALVDREDGTVLGFGGLVHPGGQAEVEIKYALKPAYWGRGLATEAATALLTHGAALGLDEIIATIAPDNVASHRVLMKAGMLPAELRQDDDGSATQVYRWRVRTS